MDKVSRFLPDGMAILGISMLGYGLYLFHPGVAFAVVGALILIGGLMLGKRGGNG